MISLRSLLKENVSRSEARRIYDKMGYKFDFDEFVMGINVEREHIDVVGKNPETWAKIAAAHLNEVPNYYTLLKKHVEK